MTASARRCGNTSARSGRSARSLGLAFDDCGGEGGRQAIEVLFGDDSDAHAAGQAEAGEVAHAHTARRHGRGEILVYSIDRKGERGAEERRAWMRQALALLGGES